MRSPDTVYIARGLASGLFKIGVTANVHVRMCVLRSTIGEDIDLVATMQGSGSVERALHRRFSALVEPSRGREWFHDDGSITAFLESLPAANRGSMLFTAKPRARKSASRRSPEELAAAAVEKMTASEAWYRKHHGHGREGSCAKCIKRGAWRRLAPRPVRDESRWQNPLLRPAPVALAGVA